MILILILSCIIIRQINKSLAKLEYKQEILCYDMYILDNEIKREESRILGDCKYNSL